LPGNPTSHPLAAEIPSRIGFHEPAASPFARHCSTRLSRRLFGQDYVLLARYRRLTAAGLPTVSQGCGGCFRGSLARLGVTAPLGFLPGISSACGHSHTPHIFAIQGVAGLHQHRRDGPTFKDI